MPPRNRAALIAPSKPRQLSWASPAQQEAFEYGPAPLLLSGGYGASKTFGAVFKVLALSDMYAKNRGVIIRRVGKQLRLTTQSTFFKLCPPAAYSRGSWNQQEGRLVLNNGSEILFLHLDDPSSKDIMRGLEINWFLFDQAEEAEEEDFDHLLGRLGRWDQAVVSEWMIAREVAAGRTWAWLHPDTGAPIPPTYPILTANPDHELHWLWRRFHEDSPEWRDKWSALGYKILHMSSLDNKFLPRQNREYLLAQDDAFKRRYVFGKWGIPEGAIHDVPSCQLIPGTRAVLEWIRANCSLYRSMDHGDTSPTCVLWWAVTRAGDVICYREYYRPNALITDHRATVAVLSEHERYEGNIADPSIFYKMMQKQMVKFSVADEWSDSTNYPRESSVFWTAGNNDELGTRNRINEYLRVDKERINIFTKLRGAARLYFIVPNRDVDTNVDEYPNACEHVIRQLRSQRRQRVGTDAGRPLFIDDRDETVPDHAYDPLRYFIATRPSPYPLRVHAHEEQFSFMAVRERAIAVSRPPMGHSLLLPPARNIYSQIARFKRRI